MKYTGQGTVITVNKQNQIKEISGDEFEDGLPDKPQILITSEVDWPIRIEGLKAKNVSTLIMVHGGQGHILRDIKGIEIRKRLIDLRDLKGPCLIEDCDAKGDPSKREAIPFGYYFKNIPGGYTVRRCTGSGFGWIGSSSYYNGDVFVDDGGCEIALYEDCGGENTLDGIFDLKSSARLIRPFAKNSKRLIRAHKYGTTLDVVLPHLGQTVPAGDNMSQGQLCSFFGAKINSYKTNPSNPTFIEEDGGVVQLNDTFPEWYKPPQKDPDSKWKYIGRGVYILKIEGGWITNFGTKISDSNFNAFDKSEV